MIVSEKYEDVQKQNTVYKEVNWTKTNDRTQFMVDDCQISNSSGNRNR